MSSERNDPRSARITVCTAITTRDIEPDVKADICNCIDGEVVKVGDLSTLTREQIRPILFNDLPDISRSTIKMLNWTHGLRLIPLSQVGQYVV